MDQLLQPLMAETQARQPAPAAATGSVGLETLLQNLLLGSLASVRQSRPGPIRRDWNTVVCFSCGKPGHSANRCPTLDDSFPFMLPGWWAEKVAGGYAMISPRQQRSVAKRKTATDPGGISNNVKPQDPGGGGATRIAAPRDGVAVWTGTPPLPARVVPQSVPVRVSVVLVEDTPGGNTGELPSSLPGEVCSVLGGAAPRLV